MTSKFDQFLKALVELLAEYNYTLDGSVYGDIAVYDRDDRPGRGPFACDLSDQTKGGSEHQP